MSSKHETLKPEVGLLGDPGTGKWLVVVDVQAPRGLWRSYVTFEGHTAEKQAREYWAWKTEGFRHLHETQKELEEARNELAHTKTELEASIGARLFKSDQLYEALRQRDAMAREATKVGRLETENAELRDEIKSLKRLVDNLRVGLSEAEAGEARASETIDTLNKENQALRSTLENERRAIVVRLNYSIVNHSFTAYVARPGNTIAADGRTPGAALHNLVGAIAHAGFHDWSPFKD
jgi:hypothetical protein